MKSVLCVTILMIKKNLQLKEGVHATLVLVLCLSIYYSLAFVWRIRKLADNDIYLQL